MKKILIGMVLFFSFTFPLFSADYKVQKSESKVSFVACCHTFVSDVEGVFTEFTGTAEVDAQAKKIVSLSAEIQADSVDSGDKRRDRHLRANDFFAVSEHPIISFQSEQIDITAENEVTILGNLTIKGIKKEVELKGKVLTFSSEGLKIEASGTINSKDFKVGTSKQKDTVTLNITASFQN